MRGFTSISPLYTGCGIMFCASTYADNIGLTFTSDRNMMPDPELMRACLDEAVEQLARYLDSKKKRGARKKPVKKAATRGGKTSKTLAA